MKPRNITINILSFYLHCDYVCIMGGCANMHVGN